jgi:hypothetical protein
MQQMSLRQLLDDCGREELDFVEERARTGPGSVHIAALEVLVFQREFGRIGPLA